MSSSPGRRRPPNKCRLRSSSDDDDINRLSNLPDSVISYILSFLPTTKDVVATSVLSKRWEFLWQNIHNLFFSNYHLSSIADRNIKFAHFVNKVLLLLRAQSIHEFCLEIVEDCELYDVTTWIATPVARQVEVLKLHFDSPYSFRLQFPRSLFTCKTIVDLDLYATRVLSIPVLVDLPNLRSIHLDFVQCDESIRNLISGCSSLETLDVRNLLYDGMVFTIFSPTLRNLTYIHLQASYHKNFEYEVKINAPSLRYLNLNDCSFMNFSVENLCSLDEAKIRAGLLFASDPCFEAVVKLLQGVYNVKHLLLSGAISEALSDAGVFLSFPRLTQLDVGTRCSGNSLLNLVKGSNNLEYLTITITKVFSYGDMPCTILEKVPVCLLSCLQEVSIHVFKGSEDQLATVAYILKNAKVLRTMTIKAVYTLDLEAKFQLVQKILEFPRGSEECKIVFS